MSLLLEDNNLGTMTIEEAYQFFGECKSKLNLCCTMFIGKVGGSFYNDINQELAIDERDLNKSRWEVKEVILHEMAHYLTQSNSESIRHGLEFYKKYTALLLMFMAGESVGWMDLSSPTLGVRRIE